MSPLFKKKGFFFILIIASCSFQKSDAQKLTSAQKKEFAIKEDSIKNIAHNIVFAIEAEDRFRSDSLFIRMLVRSLKMKNSFYYPFDSLQSISRLYAPDSSFRIFTWELKKDEVTYFHRGAIQMRTADGALKLIPLHDVSEFSVHPEDSVRTSKNWIGALYYRIIEKKFNGKKIYTLLGFDSYGMSSTKKWMEVLTFNDEDQPIFGGPYISFREDSLKKPFLDRFCIEYKKEAGTTFNFDPEMNMIIYDHLVPENNDTLKKFTYVPDGDFEGFKWQNGQWVHVDKVFNPPTKMKDGDFPKDAQLRDDNGNLDENKLLQQSKKNQQKSDSTRKNGGNN